MPSFLRLVALLVALWATPPAQHPGAPVEGPLWSVSGGVERVPLDDGAPRARRPEQGSEATGSSRPGSEDPDGPAAAGPAGDRAPRTAHGASAPWAVVAAVRATAAQAFLRVNGSADGHGRRA